MAAGKLNLGAATQADRGHQLPEVAAFVGVVLVSGTGDPIA